MRTALFVRSTLERHGGNISSAREPRLHRQRLQRRLRGLGVSGGGMGPGS